MTITEIEAIASEGKYIARKNNSKYADCYFKKCTLLKGETEEDFVEVDTIPARERPEIPYDEAVNAKIRERYTESMEFSILRQKDTNPDKHAEYEEYYAYCEQCKNELRPLYE